MHKELFYIFSILISNIPGSPVLGAQSFNHQGSPDKYVRGSKKIKEIEI